jgi:A/G-specific adenine glycosylase
MHHYPKKSITEIFLDWFSVNKRALPWRLNKSPYHILLSEVIMQQTRIEQGIPYYLNILDTYPDIEHLASSNEETLLRLWQGLGYYTRARNLHSTAKYIVEHCNGTIPSSFESLRKLKGIGDYTAAAIASIAFNEPVPVIDGNVIRVVSRLFAVNIPYDTKEGKNKIKQQLTTIFSTAQPGTFNEAMMDFGALQCIPAHPVCSSCPLNTYCKAFKGQCVNKFPIKTLTKEIKIRNLNYLCIVSGEHRHIVMQQRQTKDIWKNLYEFPLIETENVIEDKQLNTKDFWKPLALVNADTHISFKKNIRLRHKLTHRLLQITITIAVINRLEVVNAPFSIMSFVVAEQKPKPVVLARFLKQNLFSDLY